MSAFFANKYRPSLTLLMQLCSSNYVLMMRIMADIEQVGDVREFFISEQLFYQIKVSEVTKYTSLVTIAQTDALAQFTVTKKDGSVAELIRPSMMVRLYHDAQMAEVISCQKIRGVKPRYDYPNDTMHLPDEKQQINQFLKEWLQLCLQHGQVDIAEFQS